ncbi:MAG TPA: radical SAM protein [Candidatus Polarisedimenticolaceae bacterium]
MSVERRGAWTLRLGPEATTLGRGDEAVYTFDLEGRPVSWWDGETTFKRSLASDVHTRRGDAAGRERRVLAPGEALDAFGRVLETARSSPWRRLERLEVIARWTPETLAGEKVRFEAAYLPISILPPDQYGSVVLQATFGCSWNRCTFCGFYQDRPFRARAPVEFAAHVEAVRGLLGRGAALRKSIFLADGNALLLSRERLEPMLDAAAAAFPGRRVHGFVDVVTGERKPAAEWRALRERGLTRVHVGVETGHAPLLSWMHKPGSPGEAAAFVGELKAAGLSVGLIVMVGAGGDRFAAAHVSETLALLSRLPLGRGDLVYLSPFLEHASSVYATHAAAEGVRALSESRRAAQYALLRDGARAALPGVRVALYDLREFLY